MADNRFLLWFVLAIVSFMLVGMWTPFGKRIAPNLYNDEKHDKIMQSAFFVSFVPLAGSFCYHQIRRDDDFLNLTGLWLLPGVICSFLITLKLKKLEAKKRQEKQQALGTIEGCVMLTLVPLWITFALWGCLGLLNCLLDFHATQSRKVKVADLYVHSSKKSGVIYGVRFVDWRNPQETVDIQVKRELYHELSIGKQIVLTTKPGLFGVEWVLSVEHNSNSKSSVSAFMPI
jgi:hypothetical protein